MHFIFVLKKLFISFIFYAFLIPINAQIKTLINQKFSYLDTLTTRTHILPYVGYNHYDKVQFGICFYRHLMNEKEGFNWIISPAIQSQKKIIGNASLIYKKSLRKNLVLKCNYNVKSYNFKYINQNQYINQNLNLLIKKEDTNSNLGSKIIFTKNGIKNNQYIIPDTLGNPLFYDYPDFFSMYFLQSQTYFYKKINQKNLINLQLNIEFGSHFKTKIHDNLKTSINLKWQHEFDKKKFFNTSLFIGTFLVSNNNSINSNFFRNNYSNTSDYKYDETLMGRSEGSFSDVNPWKKQIFDSENNSMRFSENKIYNNKWLISQNNDISLPGFIPFKLYFDWRFTQEMAFSNIGTIYFKPEFYYSSGINVTLLNNTFEFFVPLVYSKNLYFRTPNSPLGFYGFKLNLNNLQPQKIKKTLRLEDSLEIL